MMSTAGCVAVATALMGVAATPGPTTVGAMFAWRKDAAGSVGQPPGESGPAAVRSVKEWNLKPKTSLALGGYDPVAYFPEGGGVARRGSETITAEHRGAVYRFVNEANREMFISNPARYEPAHGGWCSWAMREGEKVDIDPESFLVRGDRLFLFYKGFWGDTRKQWLDSGHERAAALADAEWRKISREEPRRAPALPPSSHAPKAPPPAGER
jgi:YHS domain-containing protein